MINSYMEDRKNKLQLLRQEYQSRKQELLKLLEDWHHMHSVVKPRLSFVYESIFGDLEIEIKNKTGIESELQRRVDLLSKRVDRGEKITHQTLRFVDLVIENEFKKPKQPHNSGQSKYRGYSGKFNGSTKFNSFGNQSRPVPKTITELKREREIPHLYRTIVKNLHPDIVGESDNFKRYWNNVQDAYRRRNLCRLKMFFKTLCTMIPESNDNIFAEEISLKAEIRELEANIRSEQERLTELKDKEPFAFEPKLKDKFWIARRKRKLKEKLSEINGMIKSHQNRIYMLTADVSAPQPQRQEQMFGSDIFTNNYAMR